MRMFSIWGKKNLRCTVLNLWPNIIIKGDHASLLSLRLAQATPTPHTPHREKKDKMRDESGRYQLWLYYLTEGQGAGADSNKRVAIRLQ